MRSSPPPASGDDPEAHALADERRRAVLDALATLPADQRAALVLVDMEGYSVAETAAILDCAEGTIKSRCSRGRARLAPLLAALRPPSPSRPEGNPPAGADVPSTGTPRRPARPRPLSPCPPLDPPRARRPPRR